jgi:hypothetical protein
MSGAADAGVKVSFRPRATPLAVMAAAARGAAAEMLADRLCRRDDAALGRLAGVAGPGLLVVIGAERDLPWVDGIVYLGKDAGAPSLLLPTTLEPDVPAPLFERAMIARAGDGAPPLAVLLDPPAIVGTGAARPIRRAELSAFLERTRSRPGPLATGSSRAPGNDGAAPRGRAP